MSDLKPCIKADHPHLGKMLTIEVFNIGLPDIQQPFVWSNTKVRTIDTLK